MNTPIQPATTSRREFLKISAAFAATFALSQAAPAQLAGTPTTGLLPRSIHPYPNKIAWGTGTLSLSKRAMLAVGRDCDAGIIETVSYTHLTLPTKRIV